ncbi:DUF3352 domain-containing protein [Sphingobacteriales bacterium UPWRP_1]|nr:hypothetical protein BVG80_04310 [Sphingobacteriales bacterium TSM_CSM]PSJ76046.1 DUF3352 domain-containing protein [Sphingobacteriales bacterium UPWRP_1]
MKKLFFLVFLAIIGWLVFSLMQMNNEPLDPPTDLYTLLPGNAIYVAEIEQPIEKWEQFSSGAIWQHLKTNAYLASVNQSAEGLREVLSGKETLLKKVLSDDMLVSAHITEGGGSYDYLYAINLYSLGRLNKALPVIVDVFEKSGYRITKETYKEKTIYKLTDETGATLHFYFLSNTMLASYSLPLLKKAIETNASNSVSANPDFVNIQAQTPRQGLSNLYVQYRILDDFLGCYTGNVAPPMKAAIDMLSFSGLHVKIADDALEFNGKSLTNPKSNSYLKAITQVGKAELKAHNILPANTSFFLSICFDDFNNFRKALGEMQGQEPEDENKGFIGELIERELNKELPQWIDRELAIAMVPQGEKDEKQTYVAVIPTGNNQEIVAEKLSNILTTLDQLNPLSIFQNDKKKEYNGYRIIKLPGAKFLRNMGGGLLKDLEKPYMALIDEYLVLCDSEDILKQMIDHYKAGTTLSEGAEYKAFFNNFKDNSNIFVYLQSKELYPFLQKKLKGGKQQELEANKDYFLSFPHIGLQMLPEDTYYQTYLYANFEPVR